MKEKFNKNSDFIGFTPEQLETLGQNSEIEYSHVINVYLAGKIKPNGWRQKLIDIRNNFFIWIFQSLLQSFNNSLICLVWN